ncbi:hypothetical protein HAX54_043763 [Datura stramonium]|uniref:Uncharacterized protein n=1 Tax=Datura stramonium TaxID=4076 RepID=A0ABS8SNJ4_DATST|nr:hypothetical protein [Datura stramonium]
MLIWTDLLIEKSSTCLCDYRVFLNTMLALNNKNQQEYYYYDAAAGKPIAVYLQETQDCTRPSTARVKPNSEANSMEQLKGDSHDFSNAKRAGKKDTEKPVGEGNMGQQLAENFNSNKENSLAS